MKKSMKKGLSLILGASMLLGSVGMIGCSNQSQPSKEPTTETAKDSSEKTETNKKDIEITLASRWGGEDPAAIYFRDKVDEFNKLDNGITIVGDHVTEEGAYMDKLNSQIAAGNQPDIFIEYGGTKIKDLMENDILLDLKPYLDEDPEWRDSFLPLFDKWQDGETDSIYGVPVMLYAIVLYYNDQILVDNGLVAPNTLEDLKAVCDTLVSNGVSPFMLGEKSNFRAGHFLNNIAYKAYGADIAKDLADRTVKYDDPKMLEMYNIIKEFNDKGYFGDNALGVDNNGEKAAFLTGESAFRFDGAWFVSEINGSAVEQSIQVTAFPSINPEFENVFQGGAGQGFSITKRDDEETNAAAVEVVKYLTSKDYYKGLEEYTKGGIYPVKFESSPDLEVDALTLQVQDVISDATAYMDDLQNYDPETHMLNTVRTALQELFTGATPEEVAKDITNKMEIK